MKANSKLLLSYIINNPKIDFDLLSEIFGVSVIHISNWLYELVEQGYLTQSNNKYFLSNKAKMEARIENVIFSEEIYKEEFDWKIDYIPDIFEND